VNSFSIFFVVPDQSTYFWTAQRGHAWILTHADSFPSQIHSPTGFQNLELTDLDGVHRVPWLEVFDDQQSDATFYQNVHLIRSFDLHDVVACRCAWFVVPGDYLHSFLGGFHDVSGQA
jgi:hypothetical protein